MKYCKLVYQYAPFILTAVIPSPLLPLSLSVAWRLSNRFRCCVYNPWGIVLLQGQLCLAHQGGPSAGGIPCLGLPALEGHSRENRRRLWRQKGQYLVLWRWVSATPVADCGDLWLEDRIRQAWLCTYLWWLVVRYFPLTHIWSILNCASNAGHDKTWPWRTNATVTTDTYTCVVQCSI